MPPVLQLVQRPTSAADDTPRIAVRDVYDLDDLDLASFAGMTISSACDQRFLIARADRISAWVRSGGRLLFNGHPYERIVDGLPKHRNLDFHSIRDLWLTEMGSHPIWDGVDRRDVLFNTGVPGQHSFEDLTRIGVAGFYAHSYLVDLPEDAVIITGIGPGRLPVDMAYPLGRGEVIVHAGNDVTTFSRPGTSAADLGERVLTHLENAAVLQEVGR